MRYGLCVMRHRTLQTKNPRDLRNPRAILFLNFPWLEVESAQD